MRDRILSLVSVQGTNGGQNHEKLIQYFIISVCLMCWLSILSKLDCSFFCFFIVYYAIYWQSINYIQLFANAKVLKILEKIEKLLRFLSLIRMHKQMRTLKDFLAWDSLEKYMYLGTCNLFFADKIIMVEGITEKIILPQLLKKIRYIQLNMVWKELSLTTF